MISYSLLFIRIVRGSLGCYRVLYRYYRNLELGLWVIRLLCLELESDISL